MRALALPLPTISLLAIVSILPMMMVNSVLGHDDLQLGSLKVR